MNVVESWNLFVGENYRVVFNVGVVLLFFVQENASVVYINTNFNFPFCEKEQFVLFVSELPDVLSNLHIRNSELETQFVQ